MPSFRDALPLACIAVCCRCLVASVDWGQSNWGYSLFGFPVIRINTLPAVNTPIMKPTTKAPNNNAARGIVTLKNSIFVSTDSVFCRTTINTRSASSAMAAIFSFLHHVLDSFVGLGLPV